jgi:hypothetical protein
MRVFEWIMRSFAMAAVFIAFFYFVVMPIYEFATS